MNQVCGVNEGAAEASEEQEPCQRDSQCATNIVPFRGNGWKKEQCARTCWVVQPQAHQAFQSDQIRKKKNTSITRCGWCKSQNSVCRTAVTRTFLLRCRDPITFPFFGRFFLVKVHLRSHILHNLQADLRDIPSWFHLHDLSPTVCVILQTDHKSKVIVIHRHTIRHLGGVRSRQGSFKSLWRLRLISFRDTKQKPLCEVRQTARCVTKPQLCRRSRPWLRLPLV